ncbi:hypothetical protein FM113_11430 [Leucobacter sp. 7(1)]|uniref:hypothetical protein n=1 Tax=Leucobacter sp. 7(1) TaxID=1255613 RepID=UPI00097E800F|nr:hypothetical protein [Leucobacter sp. 7(1)]SJN11240.1 hypothetical protein FM113_11430 [Leucobacter sp. 7(1)]
MRKGVWPWTVPLILGGLVLTGCSIERDSGARQATRELVDVALDPLTGNAAIQAEQNFEALQSSLPELESFSVSGVIDTEAVQQTFDLEVDRSSREFTGVLGLELNGGALAVEIIRAQKLTWLRSSDEYWAAQGFDAATIERARGKFVAFEPATGEQIASTYDITPLLEVLSRVPQTSVEVSGAMEWEDGIAVRYSVRSDSGTLGVDLPEGDTARFRLVSEEGGANSVFTFERLNGPVDIVIPAPETVMQPET